MRQKTFFSFMALLLGCFSSSFAQEIISSSGEEYVNDEAQINFTIGETVSGSHQGPIHLTEGFHQVLDFGINIIESTREVDFIVYPNPSVNNLYIETEEFLNTKVQIIDNHGRIIQEEQLYSNRTQIDIKNLSSGMYILSLKNPIFTFQSIQIIKAK